MCDVAAVINDAMPTYTSFLSIALTGTLTGQFVYICTYRLVT